MSSPRTILDARFSDPGTQATDWPGTREALEAAELFWLSTVRADGRPHVTPLVAVWTEDRLHFCTGPEEQRCTSNA
jgi:predicted pyridoxine 5'-phosphate oxidase superfamily flavin-nucleotide-binding protein